MKTITCLICGEQIVAEVSGKLVSSLDDKIKHHAKSHTLAKIIDFIELDLARQANELLKEAMA